MKREKYDVFSGIFHENFLWLILGQWSYKKYSHSSNCYTTWIKKISSCCALDGGKIISVVKVICILNEKHDDVLMSSVLQQLPLYKGMNGAFSAIIHAESFVHCVSSKSKCIRVQYGKTREGMKSSIYQCHSESLSV